MKKKICISIGIVLIILIIVGIITNYADSGRVTTIEIEYEGQTITITDIKDIGIIENILLNSKYNNEICDGINTHKITLNNDVYYIKESCKEIQKGDKQANITDEDLRTIKSIINNKINDEQNNIIYNPKFNRSPENVTNEENEK